MRRWLFSTHQTLGVREALVSAAWRARTRSGTYTNGEDQAHTDDQFGLFAGGYQDLLGDGEQPLPAEGQPITDGEALRQIAP
jgi:hypothetical protein